MKTTHNKGAVVVGISEKDVDDIYAIRSRIEGLAARWAAEHVTEKELEDLREIVELQEFYAAKDNGIIIHLIAEVRREQTINIISPAFLKSSFKGSVFIVVFCVPLRILIVRIGIE